MSYWLSVTTKQEVPRRERLDRVADFDTEIAAAVEVARRWPTFDCAPYIDEAGAPVLLVWATRALAQAGVTPTAVVDTDEVGFREVVWAAAHNHNGPTLTLIVDADARTSRPRLLEEAVTAARAFVAAVGGPRVAPVHGIACDAWRAMCDALAKVPT